MDVKAFLMKKECNKKWSLSQLEMKKNQHHLYFSKAVRLCCGMIARDKSLQETLQETEGFIRENYQAEWFEMPVLEQVISEDVAILERFLKWFYQEIKPDAISIKANSRLNVRGTELEVRIPLVIQEKDGVTAYLIERKNSRSISCMARKKESRPEYDLALLSAKKALNEIGCDSDIVLVTLLNGEDKVGNLTEFRSYGREDKNSNLFHLQVEKEKVEPLFQESLTLPEKRDCRNCIFRELCILPTFTDRYKQATIPRTAEQNGRYRLPVFTREQKKAIQAANGPLLLACGPGSGKTATLIGRAVYLMDTAGVAPQNILLVTFTKKAAEELKERLSAVLRKDILPTVTTLNALGYDILRNNRKYLGFVPKLMTDTDRLRLIKEVLAKEEMIHGLSYEHVYGEYGLLKTFCKKMFCMEGLDEDVFLEKLEKEGIDSKAFLHCARKIKQAIEEEGYIGYDDQIALCNRLFEQHPELEKQYRQIFRYIMVDEFQDTNQETFEFLMHLAGKNGNLCCAGDDDQSIYGFRGGSNRYLVEFRNYFPRAKEIRLLDNFRSTSEIVNAADRLIRKESYRIEKQMIPHRRGVAPIICENTTLLELENAIEGLVKEGYAYGDIAILARRNVELDYLHESLQIPCMINKCYLRTDAVFLVLLSILALYYDGLGENEHFYRLVAVFDEEEAGKLEKENGKSIYETSLRGRKDIRDVRFWEMLDPKGNVTDGVLCLLSQAFALIETGASSPSVIRKIMGILGITEHIVLDRLYQEMRERPELLQLPALYEYMKNIHEYADSERLDPLKAEAVTLATCHDAKGLEWPAVILWKAESFSVKTTPESMNENDYEALREERRLLFVTMTRAKERLILMQVEPEKGLGLYRELCDAVKGKEGEV